MSSDTQKTREFLSLLCAALATLCLLYACYIALRYAAAPLVDRYAFRQTQTALTAYWLSRDGISLAYETPVAGHPWAIPFEFPIYQYLVVLISRLLIAGLEPSGRLLSFAFTVACLFPVRSVVKKLALPNSVFFAFVALFFSSSIYLYWGRSFMIETAALFFAVCSLPFFLDVIRDGRLRPALAFAVFASLGILQKATTEAPLLVLLGLVYVGKALKDGGLRAVLGPRRVMIGVICFAIPLAIGAIWTIYSDAVKAENPLGAQLTSKALDLWNWGTWQQRVSKALFVDVIWHRIILDNLGGYLGAAAYVAAPYVLRHEQADTKSAFVFCVAAGILPLFFFPNLHIIHTYYQTANVAFLIFGLALIAGFALESTGQAAMLAMFALVLGVVMNLYAFDRDYSRWVTAKSDIYNSRFLAIGDVIAREVPENQAFVAFGNDWSSTLAYFSKRKSFTVPGWFAKYDEVLKAPQTFIGDMRLGAVLACMGGDAPALAANMRWMFARGWDVANVYGCYMAVPNKSFPATQPIDDATCEGKLDPATGLRNVDDTGSPVIRVLEASGWTTLSGVDGTTSDEVYLSLDHEGQAPIIRRAIQVPRAVKAQSGGREIATAGFSLVADAQAWSGPYVLSVIRRTGAKFERCQWRVPLTVD